MNIICFRINFLLLFLLLSGFKSLAQSTLEGHVFDINSKKQLPEASIRLINDKSFKLLIQTTSDSTGQYVIQNIIQGNYILVTTYEGYSPDSTKISIDKDPNTKGQLNILLYPSATTLKTVQVTAKKPLIRFDRDKIVFNIDQSIITKGNSLWDLLAKSPGVETDGNNISILGLPGVSVLINGRPTMLLGDQLANYLKGITGDQIAQIEIIQHPGAKYAMGQGTGVINVILKKNQSQGLNGTVSLTYGRGHYNKYAPAININYRTSKFNIYGNYALNDNKDFIEQPSYVKYEDQALPVYFNQAQHFVTTTVNHNFTLGADYQINSNNAIGFFLNASILRKNSDYSNITTISNPNKIDSIVKTNSTILNPSTLQLYNLYYSLKIDKTSNLTLNADFGYYTSNNSQNYQFQFFNADQSKLRNDEIFSNTVPGNIKIKAFSADYTKKITPTINFEGGIKSSETAIFNSTFYTKLMTGTNVPLTSGNFNYDEKINAAYVTVDKTSIKDYIKFGLRAESTNAQGSTTQQENLVNRQYLKFFPNILYTHEFDKKNSVIASYSTSFERPNYTYLSPFAIQRDPNSFSSGNPFLLPSYTNSFEFDYLYLKRYKVGLEYDDIHDRIEQSVQQDYNTDIIANVITNIAHCYYYRVYFLIPISITKWWQSNNTWNNYIIRYNTPYLNGEYNVSKPVFYINSINSFTINPSTSVDLTGYFRTPSLNGLYNVGTRKFVDVGIKKNFDKNKASLSLAVTDVFNTNKWQWDINYLNQNSGYKTSTDSRVLRIAFSYKFGNNGVKAPKKRITGISDEKNRIR